MSILKQVETISRSVMQSDVKAEGGRTHYLQALVTGTQEALGKKGAEKPEQLAALRATHESFYEAVLRVAEEFVPKHTKDRGVHLHARANFARTALSVLRMYISGGNDVMALQAEKVTKATLRARAGPVTPRARSARVLRGRVERSSKAFMGRLIELADADPTAAAEEMRLLIDQLTEQLEQLSAPEPEPVRRGRPLKSQLQGHGPVDDEHASRTFKPSATTVQRAQTRPQ